METILVTGGCGFIGSHFIKKIFNDRINYNVLNVDKLTYSGNINNTLPFVNNRKYKLYIEDISEYDKIRPIFESNTIDGIINFAAESHVDRSIEDDTPFVKTNVTGTLNLLRLAKEFKVQKFLQISTDEVYGSNNFFVKEDGMIKPSSPYSASKAAADMFVQSYNKTFGLNTLITRSSNNYGPNQHWEKLIPYTISKVLGNLPTPVYGNGENFRDWIYVTDNVNAILKVYEEGTFGSIYNISTKNTKSNIWIVNKIIEILVRDKKLIQYVPDRLGHDYAYTISNEKIKKELSWEPLIDLEEGLIHTIDWYKDNPEWLYK